MPVRPIPHRESGFSLVELIVSLAVSLVILLAILAVVEMGGRVTRVETQTAAMQQSLRASHRIMTRTLRMAGRGGLPRGLPGLAVDRGPALSVRNDVGAGGGGRDLAPGLAGSPQVVEGSDVVAVRAVFDTPLYQVNSELPGSFVLSPTPGDPATATGGVVVVSDPGPTGVPQDLTPLRDAIQADAPEALVLVSPLGGAVYAVVELDPGSSDVSGFPASVTVGFKVTGGTHTDAYRQLFPAPAAGQFPAQLQAVASLGLLEEHRFYVREAEPPRLSRARFYPNTEAPWRGDPAQLTSDVADAVLDLQVALGFDSSIGGFFAQDADNEGSDDELLEAADGGDDDWLFNGAGDDPAQPPWSPPWSSAAPRPSLYYVRLTTLGRTTSPDREHLAPHVTALEDHAYGESPQPATELERRQRLYHRGLLTSVVDLRNL